MSEERVIRAGREDELPQIVALLARALTHDPFVRWLIEEMAPISDPLQSRSARRLTRYLEVMVKTMAWPRGRIDVAVEGERLVGAALWAPPGTWQLSLMESLAVLWPMARVTGIVRLSSVMAILDEIDHRRQPDPRWLLTLVGVDPLEQGRGIGREVLSPGLIACDDSNLPAILETSNEGNVAFYQKLGFRCHQRLETTGPEFWLLTRRRKGRR